MTRNEIVELIGVNCSFINCGTCVLKEENCGIKWKRPTFPNGCPSFRDSPIEDLYKALDIIELSKNKKEIEVKISLDSLLK